MHDGSVLIEGIQLVRVYRRRIQLNVCEISHGGSFRSDLIVGKRRLSIPSWPLEDVFANFHELNDDGDEDISSLQE